MKILFIAFICFIPISHDTCITYIEDYCIDLLKINIVKIDSRREVQDMNRRINNNYGSGFPRNSPPYQANMPNRQSAPFQNTGYQPPGYMPVHNINQRQGGSFRQSSRQQRQMHPQQHMAPMRRSQQPNTNNSQKGGLLSKILGKSKQRNEPTPSPFSLPSNSTRGAGAAAAVSQAAASSASSGGILQSIMNPANLTSMLNNTQKVLQAAESFSPLVQQYGPLVKNLPAMWKLYRGLNDVDTTENEDKTTQIDEPTTINESNKKTAEISEDVKVDKKPTHIKPHMPHQEPVSEPFAHWRKGESKPKLFV